MAASEKESAAAGARKFPGSESRKFDYFEPQGRTATLYEDLTVDVQPDPDRYLLQGWIIDFADGLPTYTEKRTAMKSVNWHRFRSTDQEWDRTHYQRQSTVEGAIKMISDNARAQGVAASFDPSWVPILQNHVGALKHPEYALGIILMQAQRDGMSQMINTAILTNASYKLRFSQDLTLYLAEIGLDLANFDVAAGKQHWLEDPLWQESRKAVETIRGVSDYLEAVFASNLFYESLVTGLVRNFAARFGAAHGDSATPSIIGFGQADYQRNLANSVALFQLLLNDDQHADHNRGLALKWAGVYGPMCVRAAQALRPLWSQPRIHCVTFEDAFEQARNDTVESLAKIDQTLGKEVGI
ncbi:MAG: toluene hydroxylase [Candidatus Binataceae bacterium]